MKDDIEVYEKLVAEKCKGYRTAIAVLITLLVIFFVATVVLAVLYFGSGSMVKETEVTINTDGGMVGDGIYGSDNTTFNTGTITNTTTESNTTLIVVIVAFVSLFIVGGVVCLLLYLRKSQSI